MTGGFRRWLSEVSREDLAKIGAAVNTSLRQNRGNEKDSGWRGTGLNFDDIFKDKLRIVIPMLDTVERDIKKVLEDLGYRADLLSGMGYKVVETQKGPKTQQKRIGAILQSLATSRPDDPVYGQLLHWWEKNKKGMSAVKKTGVSVVISRSPIDILRMSDHSEWSSCHSPGNSYFRCAIQEAKTGGAVAYVVRSSDLLEVPDLQAKDIFRDNDRGIPGIQPLERIRLRNFEKFDGDGPNNLLIPELRSYGIKHAGFLETLTDWATHTQVNALAHPPDIEDYDLRGGSYQDNDAWELWANFLGTDDLSHERKKSIDQDDETEKADDIAGGVLDRANNQIEGHHWKHYTVYADYNEGGLDYFAETGFAFPVDQMVKKVPYARLIKIVKDALDGDDYPGRIRNIEGNEDRGNYLVLIHFGEEIETNLESLEHFLDEVDRADEAYDASRSKLWDSLIAAGYMPDWREELDNIPLKHLHLTWEKTTSGKYETEYFSDPEWIGDLQGVDPKKIRIRKLGPNLDSGFRLYAIYFDNPIIMDYIRSVFPEFVKSEQVNLYMSNPPLYFTSLREKEQASPRAIATPVKLYMQVQFSVVNPVDSKEIIEGVRHLDQRWDSYVRTLAAYWDRAKVLLMPVGHTDMPLAKDYLDRRVPERWRTLSSPPEETQRELPFRSFLQGSPAGNPEEE